ncbi:EscI/YscI/HrpB family type III secretion system inner rod protein [Pandoraea vervacti]|uniref:EscI/YscI/HrpB family type III secretion system inner rod protein n=1 Tax=Pandoraea vervacti TaxID=656178 RepID=A0ABM5SVH9_9BURK|nr:type III secretion system inner rod subunit SctI [Pandoraea vervacti]AJP56484.1 EscI/YscI/HrpB family type III secretion system inner rod protein [Pandoraea vervacti]
MTNFSTPQVTAHTPAATAPTLAFPSLPNGNPEVDAARFDQALRSAPSLPEHHLLNAAGKLAANTDYLAQRVTLDDRLFDDPTRLLEAQREITERVLALEFVAKVSGAMTQGVNKLVHMQ